MGLSSRIILTSRQHYNGSSFIINYWLTHICVFLQLTNAFQCVIATNGTATYAIFLYNNITANESVPAKVGFNDGMYFNMGSLSIILFLYI